MLALAKLRAKMQADNLDAFLVMQDDNRRYLSGFKGSAGILVVTPTEQYVLADSRYYERVKVEAPDWILVEAKSKIIEDLKDFILRIGLEKARIGIEADYVTVADLRKMQELLETVEFVETSNIVVNFRAVKNEVELAIIRKAVTLADQAMTHIYDWIQPGMTESEVAWELEVYMRTRGASALSFPTIVAAGANGASPHAAVSDTKIQLGDPIVVDMGCIVDGYCSDITRSFSLGEPKQEKYRAIWQIVHQANSTAVANIKPGMASDKADAFAREVINIAGHKDHFGHGLGHGVGLAIHEYPRVSPLTDAPLKAGAVVTIEPGIYLPDEFGVRLEDMAVVREEGLEILTRTPKIDVLPR